MDRSELIELYFHLGIKYTDIVYILRVTHGIVLSLRTLKRFLKKNGLFRKKHFDNVDEVIQFIREELVGSGALHGYRWMHHKCKENGLHVRKEDVRHILSSLDPAGTELRRKKRLNRRAYFARGPNFVWHVDSYDKLKPFGICINGAIDGFSRKMLWLNAYHTSSDPKVIGGYFLETVRETGGCPRILRADMGTENSCIRDVQRFLRRNDDDLHSGEKSFIYGRSTSNQRIESWWGLLRKECVEFWLEKLHCLKDEGLFDGEFLDKNLIIFCFLGIIQVCNFPDLCDRCLQCTDSDQLAKYAFSFNCFAKPLSWLFFFQDFKKPLLILRENYFPLSLLLFKREDKSKTNRIISPE